MSDIYTKRLGQRASVTAGAVNLFTVPADRVYVVQTLSLMVQGGTAGVIFTLRALGGAAAQRYLYHRVSPDSTLVLTELRMAFAAGEGLDVLVGSSSGSFHHVAAWGYDFSAL